MKLILQVVFLVTTFGLGICSAACFEIPKPGEKDVNEYFVGRSLRINDAVAQADLIIVGEIENSGIGSPGAPGQTYRGGVTVRVQTIIWQKTSKTGDPDATSGQTLSVFYTLQTIPAEIAEKAPPSQEPLILAVQRQKDSPGRIIKIMRATSECMEEVKNLVKTQPRDLR